MPHQIDKGQHHEPEKPSDRIGPAHQEHRNLADAGDKAGKSVVRRDRMRQGLRRTVGPHLLQQRRQVGTYIGEGDGVAARRQLVIGALQQPCAGRIQPLDTGEVENHLAAARQLKRAQPPVKFGGGGEQPIAFRLKDQRVPIRRCDKTCCSHAR